MRWKRGNGRRKGEFMPRFRVAVIDRDRDVSGGRVTFECPEHGVVTQKLGWTADNADGRFISATCEGSLFLFRDVHGNHLRVR